MTTPPPGPPAAPPLRPSYHGEGGALFQIQLKVFLLTIVTLGLYALWGKAEVRRYIYANTSVGGDRLAFHGTGGEMFRGWIKAVGILIVGSILATVISTYAGQIIGTLVLYGGIGLILFPVAAVGSRRYRLSRTSWRAVRFSFRGDIDDFLMVYIPGILLSVVTLGIYYPFFHANVRRFFVNETRFGRAKFNFTGQGSDLLPRFLLNVILTPLTLGIYSSWHAAYRHRYYWSHTGIGNARFRSTMTGGDLLLFSLGNVLLLIVTLGIAFPWVTTRTIRFHCERLTLVGDHGLDAVVQDARSSTATAEGLSELLDVDLIGADYFGL